ncbi:MAG: hypothetical protein ACE5HX_18870 [bacterium]
MENLSTTNRSTIFLHEFKEFFSFLQNLWGVLTGISVFFPLSNMLIKYIPLKTFDQDGVFIYFTPPMITTVSTLATLFFVLLLFSKRSKFKFKRERFGIQRHALISFGSGVLVLLTYVVGYYVVLANAYAVWGWESDDPRHLIAEVPLLVSYGAAFILITRAFMLLGMIEFFSTKQMNSE